MCFFPLVDKRKCYFSDETQMIKLHRNYSQANCYLECSIFYGQKILKANNSSHGCTPWFYPFKDEGHKMCNPWENSAFVIEIANRMPIDECRHCISGENSILESGPGVNFTIKMLVWCKDLLIVKLSKYFGIGIWYLKRYYQTCFISFIHFQFICFYALCIMYTFLIW